MSENTLYPNTFQHHNAYIDQIQFFLTGNEEKVLNRVLRGIMGWEKGRQTLTTTISLSVLVDGKISKKSGERLSYGCGLTEATIRKILKTLCGFGLIERVGKPTHSGQTYRLQLDWEKINRIAMEDRKATTDARYCEQMNKARKSNPLLFNSTPPVQQDVTPPVEQDVTPPVQQETINPSSKPISKPNTTTDEKQAAEKRSVPPATSPGEKGNGKRKRKRKRTTASPKSVKGNAWFVALAETCLINLSLATATQKQQLGQSAKLLRKAAVTPEQITAFRQWWNAEDWRGKKGQSPAPAQVRAEWGKFAATSYSAVLPVSTEVLVGIPVEVF
jgi:predicted transcriptional regulator